MDKRWKQLLLCWLSSCLILFCGCSGAKDGGIPIEPADTAFAEPEAERITLVAVGDNLLHMPIVRWCRIQDGYDFNPLYKRVKDLVQAADMAFVNQEAPLGGEGFAPSGYPNFNSPQEAGLALAAAGFTVVNQANNHGLDQGDAAVLATADFWQQVESATMIGFNCSEQERRQITVVEAHGFYFAWLAYSYGTNGMPMQEDYLMNLIDREAMAADIAAAKTVADAVIVSMHWGKEYQLDPSSEQRQLAQFLADQGVTLVIGHHPHVVQPVEWLTGRAGNRTLVAYSLGNFVSSQDKRDTMLEGMLSVVFSGGESGLIIESYGVLPLVMHYESGGINYCVYPLYEYTEELARRHYVNQMGQAISLSWLNELSAKIWGDFRILRPE